MDRNVPKPNRTFRREDRPGHLDPEHAARLLALSREEHAATSSDPQRGFLSRRERGGPDLAERLAEGAVLTATTGQDELEEEPGGELGDTFLPGVARPDLPEAQEPES